MRIDKKKLINVFIVVFLVLSSVFTTLYTISLFVIPFPDVADYKNRMTGARIVAFHDSRDLYNLDLQEKLQFEHFGDKYIFLPYRDLPLTAYLYTPLLLLSAKTGYRLTMLLLLGVVLFSVHLIKREQKVPIWMGYLLVITTTPLTYTLINTQLIPILLLIFTILYFRIKNNSNAFISGLLAGILMFKVTFIIAIPFLFFLVEKKQRINFFLGFLTSCFAFLGLSAASAGFESMLNYPKFVLLTETEALGSPMDYLYGVFNLLRVVVPGLNLVQLFIINLCLYVTTLIVFLHKLPKLNLKMGFTVTLIAATIFSVHAFGADLSVLYLPMLLIIGSKIRKENIAGILIYVALALNSFTFIGTIILLATLVYILFKANNYGNKKITS